MPVGFVLGLVLGAVVWDVLGVLSCGSEAVSTGAWPQAVRKITKARVIASQFLIFNFSLKKSRMTGIGIIKAVARRNNRVE